MAGTPLMSDRKRTEVLWNRSFVLICLATLFFWGNVFGVNTLVPLYMDDLGFSPGTIGFTLGLGALTALLGRALSGWAVDRWGTRWFLLFGAALWVVTAPLTAFVHSLWVLVGLRLAQGLGLSVFTNGALGVVTRVTPDTRRGAGMGWWGVTNNVANTVSPVVAAALWNRFSMAAGLLGAGLLGAVGMLLALVIPGDPTAPQPSAPAAPVRLITRAALLPGLVGGALGVAFGAFMTLAPLRARSLALENVGYYLTAAGVAMIFARVVFGWLSDRAGRNWAILPSLLMLIASLGLIGFVTDQTWALAVPFLFGLGSGGSMPGLMAWAVDRAAATERTTAVSTFYIIYEAGMFAGASLLGQWLNGGDYRGYLMVAGIVSLACLAYLVSLRRASAGNGADYSQR